MGKIKLGRGGVEDGDGSHWSRGSSLKKKTEEVTDGSQLWANRQRWGKFSNDVRGPGIEPERCIRAKGKSKKGGKTTEVLRGGGR